MNLRIIGIITVALFASQVFCLKASWAGKVLKVSGKQAILETYPGDDLVVGDIVFTLSGNTKKSYGKVTQVRGNQAIMTILKGNAQVNQTTLKRGAAGPGTAAGNSLSGSPLGNVKLGPLMGVMLGFSSDTATMSSLEGSPTLSGMNNEIGFFLDRKVTESLKLRVFGSYRMFNVSNGSCAGGSCSINVNYLSGRASAIYSFNAAFVGLGFNILFPASKSGQIPNDSNGKKRELAIDTVNALSLEGGYNFKLKNKVIPVWLTYSTFLSLSGMSISSMELSAGYAWTY